MQHFSDVQKALNVLQQAGFACIPMTDNAKELCFQPVLRENKIGPVEDDVNVDAYFRTLVSSLSLFTEETSFVTSIRAMDRMIQAAYMARQSPARFLYFKKEFKNLLIATPISLS